MDSIDIHGIKFLKCAKDECEWNMGYTPGDLNRSGLEFTARLGVGIRVCNFSSRALAYGKNIDSDCPHKQELCNILAEESGLASQFFGNIDPEVAKRALGMEHDSRE